MSEIRRRGTRRPPELTVPAREDAELERDAEKLDAMANGARISEDSQVGRLIGRATRSAEEEEAFNTGARLGAKALARSAGMTEPQQKGAINEERLIKAERLLMEYKSGKASIDKRIINSQDWWKMRNWAMTEAARNTQGATTVKSATAWLWNCIVGKHAEAMEAFPEPVVLPRMAEDKPEAKMLTEILPVELQMNGFDDEFSKEQWQKFLEGTGVYHIGWDKNKLGGIGDVSIRNVNLLNLFWEPGVEDIEESANLFYVQVVDTEMLEQQYPQLKGKLKNAYLKPSEYRKDDSVKVDGKSVLVDWYYHTWNGPKKVLHYCQFVNHEVLYSTENNGMEDGLYADGEYPFVLDPLYPVHGSPAGYGLIDIGKDAQMDIDTLNQAMVQNAVVTSTPRWFINMEGGLNENEYADWSKPFVHTQGMINENNIRQITTNGIDGSAITMLDRKIEELKFVTGNSDVNNGTTPGGVTAASAIAALQEYSGRGSKDSSRGTYRACNKVYLKVVERWRQFADIPRWFRILGENGQEEFVQYSNAKLKEQQLMGGLGMEPGYRKPVFDIEVRSQRETAYTKLSQNELAIQMMNLGVFNPQMTDQSLMMLDMMDFRGKDELMQKVEQQGTMLQMLTQVGQIAMSALMKSGRPEDQMAAQQLAPILQGVGINAMTAPAGGGTADMSRKVNADGQIQNETAGVQNARERAQESFRPD